MNMPGIHTKKSLHAVVIHTRKKGEELDVIEIKRSIKRGKYVTIDKQVNIEYASYVMVSKH